MAHSDAPPATPSVKVTAKSANEKYKGRTQSQTQTSASYQRALNFLRANEPERKLDIRLSYTSFETLEEQAFALYGDEKYARVEYSATDSRVTIHTIPTALHSSSAVALQQAISFSVYNVLVQHHKEELFGRLIPVGESTYRSIDDQGGRSTKIPDGGLQYATDERQELVLIIEAGVSEGYQHLKDDIDLWLTKYDCRIGILFCLIEGPRFQAPTYEDSNVHLATVGPLFESAMRQVRRHNPFGPYTYNDQTWFGTLKSAYLEVCKRDTSTNNVDCKSYPVVENGSMVVQSDRLDIGLKIADIFPSDEEAIAGIKTAPFCLETDYLRNFLATACKNTATSRFNNRNLT
ncbi:hypothetical protein V1504DRAFT_441734 [Lipomyces starkeyi]